jgi:Eco57I restriction-modification methylase
MKHKQEFGQFFTSNSDYILKGFEKFVNGKDVLDPFAGNGDLLKWAKKNGAANCYGLDIDEKLINDKIKLNNSLVSIPKSKFVITNPPYLAINKMSKKQKTSIKMDGCEDLYLLAVKRILQSDTNEGIIIVPVNFFSAENSDSLRKAFMFQYNIDNANYFKEQVFEDTTYNVIAFHFFKKNEVSIKQTIVITSFPDKEKQSFYLEEKYNYKIAGRELDKISSIKSLKLTRLTEKHIEQNKGDNTIKAFFNDKNTTKTYSISNSYKQLVKNNILLLNCIDTNGTEDGWISVEDVRSFNRSCLVGKNTSRNIAYVILPSDISIQDQEKIIPLFNKTLNTLRKKYNSLFLTNFRDNNRKRVSFEFSYKLITYCYKQIK